MSVEIKTISPNININENDNEESLQDLKNPNEIQCREGNSKSEIFIPHLRYFAVGPTVRYIKCPLCGVRNETYNVSPMNAKDKVFAILSCFSLCIPILWIPFGLLCISAWTRRKRQFCKNCGAQMGYHFRPS